MRLIVIAFCLSTCCLHAAGEQAFRWQASEELQSQAPLAQQLPSATFQTTDGEIRLPDTVIDEPFVIAVRDPGCPVSRRYAPYLHKLQDNIRVLYLLTGPLATADTARNDQLRHGLQGTYVLDTDQALSRWLGVRTSSEVYLFDPQARLRYRGAIDDRFGVGFSRAQANRHFLADALAAVRTGVAVEVPATSSPGCFVNQPSTRLTSTELTWHKDVSALMAAKCQLCHRPGQAGPFALQTYEQVAQRKSMIRFVLANKIMPPWSSMNDSSRWMNDRLLLEEERQLLIDWIDAGAPEGEAVNAAVQPAWRDGWQFGKPDIVLTSGRKLNIPADGDIPYEYVSLPTDFEKDRWVQSIEVATQAPQNAHHILLFLLPPESMQKQFIPGIHAKTTLSRREMHQLTLRGFFGGYVAGLPGVRYQPGAAKLLPKGWRILMQIHYESNGLHTSDQPSVALRFAHSRPRHIIDTRAAADIDLQIPAGVQRHHESGEYEFTSNGQIMGFFPHTHLRGTAFEYRLRKPDGTEVVLLDVPRYDPNWQFYYQLKKPIPIEAGSILQATAWYDNSAKNPNNPDPAADVGFGLRTRDEMMIGYFDWVELP